MSKLPEEVLLGMIANNGGGGTSDYSQLTNKPQINGVTLSGDKSASDLGLASLDSNGKVPAAQLPSYVDDVVNGYLHDGKFYADDQYTTEITGEDGKIYVDLATNKTYRWSGLAFVEISESLALGETSSTAYAGDKGKANADAISAITNGESINNFAGVETALSGKQNALTAGDYIDISAQNEIKVNRSIAKTQVHKYNMFFNNGRYCTITKYIDNEQVGSATTYDYLNMSPNPAEIDDVMTLKANGDTGNWLVTDLVASHDHAAGYVDTRYRGWNDNTYVQEFDVVVDADKKLIIQSELDDAIATKQDI